MRHTNVAAICVTLSVALPQTVHASARPNWNLVWIVQASNDAFPLTKDVQDGDAILKQKLRPLGLATVADRVAVPEVLNSVIPEGTQFVELTGASGNAYCAVKVDRTDKSGSVVPARAGTTVCMRDTDANGRFDIAFGGSSDPTGVIMAAQQPKSPVTVDVPYSVLSPDAIKGDFWVAIRYEQYFNIYGNRMLMTDFGGRGAKQSLTAFDTFKSKGPFPRNVSSLGARITVASAQEKGVTVTIVSPMPQQPFGVVTTTTYRFY